MTVFFTTHYMDEAQKVADCIAIIDRGQIVARGAAESLRQQTNTDSLEQAFIALTGHGIRQEEATGLDRLRSFRKRFGR